jgi:hypothetical protein
MIERQIEAPVLPGDDDGRFPLVDSGQPADQEPYIEPGGLVDTAIRELGGELAAVERLPDVEA